MKNIKEPITNEPTPYDVKTYQYTHHVLHENMCIRGLINKYIVKSTIAQI